MDIVVQGVGFEAVLVSVAAYTLCSSRGHCDSHARKPLHTSDTGRHLQGSHSRMELAHLGPDCWLVRERLLMGMIS